jgi:hypothetical protein
MRLFFGLLVPIIGGLAGALADLVFFNEQSNAHAGFYAWGFIVGIACGAVLLGKRR